MTESSSLLQSAISADGSLAAVVVPSKNNASNNDNNNNNRRHLIQIYQVTQAPSQCVLQSTLTHTTTTTAANNNNNKLTELIFCGSSLLVALFGTTEVVVWDLNRGVVAQKFLSQDEEESSFLGLAAGSDASTSSSSFYILTRFGPKLYVQEYNNSGGKKKSGKVTRKIKCGKWEGEEVDTHMGVVVSKEHIAVKSSAGIRILSLDTAKKVAKIKNGKGGSSSSSGRMVVCEETLAVLESSGSVVLYDLSNGEELTRISHDMTDKPSSSSSSSLQVVQSGKSGEYTVLIDSTIYDISGSSSEKVTQLASSNSAAALFLSKKKNNVLALVHQMVGGCRSKWIDLENNISASISLDKEEEEDTATTAEVGGKKSKRKAGDTQPLVLGPGQAGVEPSQQPILKKAKVAASGDDADDDGGEEPKDLSIAERLQQMAEAMDEEDDDDDDSRPTTTTSSFKPNKATTESLKEFLTQALQSGDESLLELALQVRDSKVISTTMKQIDPNLLRLLIGKLTTKLASNPMRAEHLAKWVSYCLRTGKFKPQQLAPLRNLLYERVESFGDLLRLQGRLSMMCDTE